LVPDQALREKDQDEFQHAAIAGRLADLTLSAETPANVALFGPWGSGKSSVYELLRRALQATAPKRVKLIRYDAWKYGGESLQRNFISHAATELGFGELTAFGKPNVPNRRFHRGLYEKQRRAGVDLREFTKSNLWLLLLFVVLFTCLVLLFAAVVGLASVLTKEDFFGEIARTLPQFVVSSGVVAALVTAAKLVLDGAKVEVEQSQPSAEEEFSKTFDELLGRAREKEKIQRFVFFIDELDRCSSEDVVATLTAIRTFLDQEDCVFVVAADREVLESALKTLPQSTPHDEETPYYSSASAFFDKIFQHQMLLPPLRGRRLTRFARDLAASRGGLWRQLRETEIDGQDFNRVIYTLIPSHVRSPRRVKVLLNAFATNVRVAQAREVDWRARATEIAKLTVLQTEFPLLAADLHQEPRLPTFLLKEPLSQSVRIKTLLKRHGGSATSSDVSPEAIAEADAPDPMLVKDDNEQLKITQHRQLRRYLERTADIPDPGRDLLYLEPAGAVFGLEDAALGELIESYATEAPERVSSAVAEREPDEQLKVLLVLADICDQEFGEERRNVMTDLMACTAFVEDRIAEVSDAVASALRGFQEEQKLSDEHLVGALRVALSAETNSDRALTSSLFERDELLGTAERIRAVAMMLAAIPSDFRSTVFQRVKEVFAEDHSVLMEPLRDLPDEVALEIFESAQGALEHAFGADAIAVADELYEATHGRVRLAQAVQGWLVYWHQPYASVRRHAEAILDSIDNPDEVNEQVLLALDSAPPDDWEFWTARLSEGGTSSKMQSRWAAAAVIKIIRQYAEQISGLDARTPLGKVSRHRSETPEPEAEKVLEAVRDVLSGREWWASEEARKAQEALHQTLRVLLDAPQADISSGVEAALVHDVERAREAAAADPAEVAPEALRGLLSMGAMAPPRAAARLYDSWIPSPPPDDARAYVLTHALIAMAASASAGGVEVDQSGLDVERNCRCCKVELCGSWRPATPLVGTEAEHRGSCACTHRHLAWHGPRGSRWLCGGAQCFRSHSARRTFARPAGKP
jgi:hypothetical protein